MRKLNGSNNTEGPDNTHCLSIRSSERIGRTGLRN